MRLVIALSVVTIMAAAATSATAQTFAERLGWEKGDRVLIMHIDDAGMSYDSNLGTKRALTEGVANSVSVMMPCPWVPHFVKWLKKNPEVDAGLHLTLTSEWDDYRWGPLAGKPAVPGLVDEYGCLWGNVPEVVANASAEEVAMEIRAQIDRARVSGFEPTHLDSHMGTLFATPEFLMAYVQAGIENGIPVMIPAGHNTLLREEYRQGTYDRVENMNKSRSANDQIDPEEVWKAEEKQRFGSIPMIAEQVWNGGLPVLDDLHNTSYSWKTTDKTDLYIEAVKSLKPGVTMMINHCTQPTEVFEHISSSGVTREGDMNAMIDPRLKKAIEDEGVIMTTWRELKERRDAAK